MDQASWLSTVLLGKFIFGRVVTFTVVQAVAVKFSVALQAFACVEGKKVRKEGLLAIRRFCFLPTVSFWKMIKR